MGDSAEIRELRGPTFAASPWILGCIVAVSAVSATGLSPYLLIVGVGAWLLVRAIAQHERRTGLWVNDSELLVGNGGEFVEQLPLAGLTVAIGYETSHWTHGDGRIHDERVQDSSALLYVRTLPPERRLVRINSAARMTPKKIRALRDTIQAEIDRAEADRL